METETSLRARAASSPEYPTLRSLSAKALQEIAREKGDDFATALLFDRLTKSPSHSPFIQRINALLQASTEPLSRNRLTPSSFSLSPSNGERVGVRETIPSCTLASAKVVIVPGALYVERPDVGGDGRLVREVAASLGLSSDIVPLCSRGGAIENARLLQSWLGSRCEEKIILVSLSKGGAEVKLALSAPNVATVFRPVVAWMNVGGPLNGSRMANWVASNPVRACLLRLQYRCQRRDFRFITDLCHGENCPLGSTFQLPPNLNMVSVVGFPLRRHLSTLFSRFCHRTLARCGPNDGTILLSDLLDWPGDIYPVWGADHYFRPESMAQSLIAALFHYLAEELAA